jgi:Mn-containing catalase
MYFHEKRLQYPVKVENPDPIYARMLQQAIGGIEGEIRVCLQYFFQGWGNRAPNTKYRDVLLNTATEEIGHIEMLATAVALNLEGAPASLQETAAASSPVMNAVMGGGERPRHAVEGMLHRHILSTGMAAFPANCDGVPFDCSHVYASGNIVGDMFANVAAEATGRTLAVRLFNAAHDKGMQDMWRFLIARDTMHQQQWLAIIDELGGLTEGLPVPNSFDQNEETKEFSYAFFGTERNGVPVQPGRYSQGPSLDGKGEYHFVQAEPLGEEPVLGPARPDSGAQKEQMSESPTNTSLRR